MEVRPSDFKLPFNDLDPDQEYPYQFHHYINILKCYIGYQGYELKDAVMDESTFMKKLKESHSITMKFEKKDKFMYVIYVSDAIKINKKILDDITKGYSNTHLIFITETDFKTFNKTSAKAISTTKKLYIQNLLHQNFITEIPKGPFANKRHKIMSEAEYSSLIKVDLKLANKIELSKILTCDPVMIWIGAKKGDVIEITGYSETSGFYKNYRLVIDIPDARKNVADKSSMEVAE